MMFKTAFCNSSVDEADIVIIGYPIKHGSKREEMADAPNEIRKATYSIYGSVYGNLNKKIADIGDVKELPEISGKPLVIGGNHLVAYYAAKKYRPENIIIFDSHPDCFIGELSHETFVRFLHEEGLNLWLVGISNPAEEERKWMEGRVEWFSSRDVFWEFEKVRKALPERAWVSIDMDVFMMNHGSYQPELLGLLPHHVFGLLEKIEIIGADICESTPSGAMASARVLVELLGLM